MPPSSRKGLLPPRGSCTAKGREDQPPVKPRSAPPSPGISPAPLPRAWRHHAAPLRSPPAPGPHQPRFPGTPAAWPHQPSSPGHPPSPHPLLRAPQLRFPELQPRSRRTSPQARPEQHRRHQVSLPQCGWTDPKRRGGAGELRRAAGASPSSNRAVPPAGADALPQVFTPFRINSYK